jgi:spore germination protein GerM
MLKEEWGWRRFLAIGMVAGVVGGLSGFLPPSKRLAAASDPKPLNMIAHLYFATTDQAFLTAEERVLPEEDDPAEYGKAIIGALIEGPQRNLMRTLPKETLLKSVYITEEGTAYVDFSDALRDHYPGGCRMELLSLYSIVNSLILNIDQIKAVKLLIGGREAQTLAGHIDTRFPFNANMLIIR